MKAVYLFVASLIVSVGAEAAQAVFSVEHPAAPEGLQLVEDAKAPLRHHEIGGVPVVSPAGNAFDKRGLSFQAPADFAREASELYLLIEHMDSAIAIIQATEMPGEVKGAALAGGVCLGTGKARRALFHFSKPGTSFTLTGIEGVRRVVLKTSLDEGEVDAVSTEVPAAPAPHVVLSRPMQLVLSAGADAKDPEGLPGALKSMRELCPQSAALGFNGVESYVKWNFVEPERGRFDWSFYDAIVEEAARHNLKWFPLLIVGSAYSLPGWYHDSPENEGFACLEHGKGNNIQSIFCENQTPYVRAFLSEFGKHYEPGGRLLGVRLGPSGNFGESQYPAGGNWGYSGKKEHIHIGWWAGDPHASPHFVHWLQQRYDGIEALNKAWGEAYARWDDVKCFIPQFAENGRKRKDLVDWYVGAMSDWCERWAFWAREGMPNTSIFQSAGGWGFVESGTDFTDQAQSMTKVHGGIRATNETDSYAQNFQVTRMMSSAARFYGIPFGSEPAGFNSAKGVASRIFNILVNDGQHLFFYYPGVLNNDSIQAWLELAPLLDQRAQPRIDVAVLYPDTQSKLDDGVFRNLYSSTFYQRVGALRPHLDFDFCSERMVMEGALSRYKVLVLAWSPTIEASVLNTIDAWVRNGGTVLCNYWDRLPLQTVEEDHSVQTRWLNGDAGQGRAVMISEDREPPHRFADRVKKELLDMPGLDPLTQAMLRTEKPDEVYVSALESGCLAVLNYTGEEARVQAPGQAVCNIAPYRIRLIPCAAPGAAGTR